MAVRRALATNAAAATATTNGSGAHTLLAKQTLGDNNEPFEFTVGVENGFLPRHDPLAELPPKFKELESILQRMPVTLPGGKKGLLYDGRLGNTVNHELPEYRAEDLINTDQRLLAALYRDYTFLASAYLLEPCDIHYRQDKTYGLGRDRLPANIARPLQIVADRLHARPFMEYALTYALYNWKRNDPSKGIDYDNLSLIRKLHGGVAEHGFVLVHVAMVAHTGEQVRNTERVLAASKDRDIPELLNALKDYHKNLTEINHTMDTMWARSDPLAYLELRSFIMGIKDQSMFPHGVIYEGVDDKPRYYRGESGANDSIIPTCDNLFQLSFPQNPLTDILKDFRTYRPVNHNQFLESVLERSNEVKVRDVCLSTPDTAMWYLANLDRVREFRARHWNFTKAYIINHTSHPTATGGSPITTWLPNQLGTVLRFMAEVDAYIQAMQQDGRSVSPEYREMYQAIQKRHTVQLRQLAREVDELSRKFKQENTKTISTGAVA